MSKETKKNVQDRSAVRRVVNLPRYGIFLPGEAHSSEIHWQTPKDVDPRPLGEVDQDFRFRCFLCNVPLSNVRDTSNKDTDEHVFAQWIQRYFDLTNQPISASDPNSITYDQLRIPACATCNNTHMSRLEDRIKKSLEGGFEKFSKLRECDIFLWCAKIYYGVIHNMALPRHWSSKTPLEPILDEKLLRDQDFLHRASTRGRQTVYPRH
jgi:hypothetical protein